MARKYDVVVTNPPYMGSSGMGARLAEFVKKQYPDSKSDLFAVFMERGREYTKANGYLAMITQHTWMFLSSFEKLRAKLMELDTVNMVHLGARAFEEIGGEVVQTTAFVMQNRHVHGFKGMYARLIEPTTQDGKEEMFLDGENRFSARQDNFEKIPGAPVAYWVSEKLLDDFDNGKALSDYAIPRTGIMTGDNGRFLRIWWEVGFEKINLHAQDAKTAIKSCLKWFPYNKGGEYRKWYGDNDYIVNWEGGGIELFENAKKEKRNAQDYPEKYKFKPAISWSLVTSGQPAFRIKNNNLSDIAGPALFTENAFFNQILSFCNSVVSLKILTMINPTINFQGGNIAQLPILDSELEKERINERTNANVNISRVDWDSFETSWDFRRHPLI